ncbi:hypothetical protein [Dankookia sp. P2]|uniref:hypothetical protein n=1 Tax=Dankookia sp. P2 TaxID=3423955 RepID=UPI003D6731E7
MELTVLLGSFTLLLLIGTPVAFALGGATLAAVFYMDLPPVVVFQQHVVGHERLLHAGHPLLRLRRRPHAARPDRR